VVHTRTSPASSDRFFQLTRFSTYRLRSRAKSVPERAENCGYQRSLTDTANGLRSGHGQVGPRRETTF